MLTITKLVFESQVQVQRLRQDTKNEVFSIVFTNNGYRDYKNIYHRFMTQIRRPNRKSLLCQRADNGMGAPKCPPNSHYCRVVQ